MTPFQKAYAVFRLEPGASKESIQRRYKRLIMVWHPDRFQSKAEKEDAEEELKIINNAKDLLWKHFDSPQHKATGCECQQSAGSQGQGQGAGHGPGPGPGPGRRSGPDDEEAAKRRDAERKRKAAADDAARQEQQRQQQQERQQQQTYETAATQEAAMKENALRWNIAKAEAATLLALCVFGWIGTSINSMVHDWQSKQEQEQREAKIKEEEKNQPHDETTSTPPPQIVENLFSAVQREAKQWTVKSKENYRGCRVVGRDDRGRLIVLQDYGPNWTFIQQCVITYEGEDKVSVDLFKAPNTMVGRTVYKYDQAHNLIEAQQLDAMQIPIVTGTIERRSGGGFYQMVLNYFDSNGAISNTRKLYTPDDPQMASAFYLFEVFGFTFIPKIVEQPSTLTSPDLVPTPNLQNGETFEERLKKLSTPPSQPGFFDKKPFTEPLPGSGPGVSLGTSTATGTNNDHLLPSPFTGSAFSGESITPAADALFKRLKEQDQNQTQQDLRK